MSADKTERTIPLFEEQVDVVKRDVISDHVRVTTAVEERDVLIEETVERGELHVERVAVVRAVTEAPEPRREGDTLIVSIVEERLTVEKQLFVVEELRITRTSKIEQVSLPHTVRTMKATVERADPEVATGREFDERS